MTKKTVNDYKKIIIDGKPYIEFTTVGKNTVKVIVDEKAWDEYLSMYSWTAIKKGNRYDVKTSINKQSNRIWRVIVEHEYDELDYWGSTIDHINNNPLDNRLENLRIYSTAILNTTNISSKFKEKDMQFIHRQGKESSINGYKVHYNLAGETFYKNFGVKEYGGVEEALYAAQRYRDSVVEKQRQAKIDEMIKKTRDIEFERGLRDKIKAGEISDILAVLKKYNIISE